MICNKLAIKGGNLIDHKHVMLYSCYTLIQYNVLYKLWWVVPGGPKSNLLKNYQALRCWTNHSPITVNSYMKIRCLFQNSIVRVNAHIFYCHSTHVAMGPMACQNICWLVSLQIPHMTFRLDIGHSTC